MSTKRVSKFGYDTIAGTHTILADVAENLGGKDEGPSPHDLIKASLAACTAMTVQMYADRKQWPLKNVDVQVEITLENGKETKFTRSVQLQGELTQEQKDRCLEIANKCPIHNLLVSSITIDTTMVP